MDLANVPDWVDGPTTLLLFLLLTFMGTTLWAVITGRLVPRAQVTRLSESWEARLADARENEVIWRTAATKSEEARSEMSALLSDLAASTRITEALISALPSGKRQGE